MDPFQRFRGKTPSYVVITLVVMLLIACSQPAAPPSPTPTQAAKAAPTKASLAETKEGKPEAKATAAQDKQGTPVAQAKKDEAKPAKLTVSYSALAGAQSPLWITKEKGLFAKYGVDVDLQYIASAPVTTQAMIAGDLGVAMGGAGSAVDAGLAGADLVTIAATNNVLAYTFFGQPNIQRIEDLKGKTVAVIKFGSPIDFAARYTLNKYGLEPEKDVALVQVEGTPETMGAMKAGAVHGTLTGPPNSLTLRKLGMRELLNIADLNIPYPTGVLLASKKFLANNRGTVTSFMQAFVEGIAVAKKDKAYAMQVIGQYTKTTDQEVLAETYEFFLTKLMARVPYVSVEGMQLILDETARKNPKAVGAKPETYIDSSILRELEESGFVKKLYGE
ncbi:MAG: ABC transporter substrate-binding protein [Chloroflexi bacterium]|nr:ABC transporter substrate-binding protein [Chloroflexota bacterium]